jgi:hypothetical protein
LGIRKGKEGGHFKLKGQLAEGISEFGFWTTDINLFNYVVNVTYD